MVALSDAARLDRLEDEVKEIRAVTAIIGKKTLRLDDACAANAKEMRGYIGELSAWLEACRVLLEDIRERLHAIDGR